jgi:hypothetical protein
MTKISQSKHESQGCIHFPSQFVLGYESISLSLIKFLLTPIGF